MRVTGSDSVQLMTCPVMIDLFGTIISFPVDQFSFNNSRNIAPLDVPLRPNRSFLM